MPPAFPLQAMQEERFYLPGYVNCYVTPGGRVYKDGRQKAPIVKEGKAPKVRLQEKNRTKEYGLATLVATHFVTNPNDYTKLIFKDANNRNCIAANIAWVSNIEFSRYSLFPASRSSHPGRKRKH